MVLSHIEDSIVQAFNHFYANGGTDADLIEITANNGAGTKGIQPKEDRYFAKDIYYLNRNLYALGYKSLREHEDGAIRGYNKYFEDGKSVMDFLPDYLTQK